MCVRVCVTVFVYSMYILYIYVWVRGIVGYMGVYKRLSELVGTSKFNNDNNNTFYLYRALLKTQRHFREKENI